MLVLYSILYIWQNQSKVFFLLLYYQKYSQQDINCSAAVLLLGLYWSLYLSPYYAYLSKYFSAGLELKNFTVKSLHCIVCQKRVYHSEISSAYNAEFHTFQIFHCLLGVFLWDSLLWLAKNLFTSQQRWTTSHFDQSFCKLILLLCFGGSKFGIEQSNNSMFGIEQSNNSPWLASLLLGWQAPKLGFLLCLYFTAPHQKQLQLFL